MTPRTHARVGPGGGTAPGAGAPSRRSATPVAALLAAALLATCGEPAPGDGAGTACPYPAAGGPRAVVRHDDPDGWLSDVPVRTTREARVLGAPSSAVDTAVALERVSDAAVDGAGHVYAADVETGRIWRFGDPGHRARRVGADGRWPLRNAGAQALGTGPGDTLRAFDLRLRTEAVFDTAGRLVGTRRPTDPRGFGPAASVAYDGRGRLHRLGYGPFAASLRAATGGRTGVVGRGEVVIERWSRRDSAWTGIAGVPGVEVYVSEGGLGDAPFGRRPLWDAGPDGSVWHADSGEYLLTRFSPSGDTLCRVDVDVDPPAVSEADRRAFLQAEDVGEYRYNARMRLRRMRRQMPLPRRRPVLERLLASAGGGVWVRPAPGTWNARPDTVTWHAFSARGELEARVRIPGDVRVERVGQGFVLGVRRTGTGVDRVVRLEVVPEE